MLTKNKKQMTEWHQELEAVLMTLDDCQIECDGMTRVISYLLNKAEIRHSCMYGFVQNEQTKDIVTPHFWIILEDGWLVDLRLRMWLGDNDTIPHGVFHPDNEPNFLYQGEPVPRDFNMTLGHDLLNVMTDGKLSHVKVPRKQDGEHRVEFNYDKSVSNAHLETAGWEMDAFNHSNPFESHVIYVRDYRNNLIRLFTINQADFEAMKQPRELSSEMWASLVAEYVLRAAKGTLKFKDSKSLAPALIGYTKSTETYRRWRRVSEVSERLHMIINIYTTGMLRPFIMRSTSTVLTTEEVVTASSQVKSMDATNHPDWVK
ncbi:hypothetical protein ACW6AV_003622 [Edwardsiella piscicida]